MKKKLSIILAVSAIAGTAAMANAGIMTTVTRSVSAEYVAASGTSGIDAVAVLGTSATPASAIYELGSGQSFAIGSKFTITLTNAQFTTGSALYICGTTGAAPIAAGAYSSSTPASIQLTASAIVPAFTAYQLFSGTSTSSCNTTSAAPGLPVLITGTSPVTIQADSTDVPAAAATAVTLYNTKNQFSATLTTPHTAVIDFGSTPASTAFVADTSVTPATTTNSFAAPFTVFSDESILIKQVTGLASNTACGTSSTSFTLNVPVTVAGTFTELATTSSSTSVVNVASIAGAPYATPAVTSTSTSVATGTTLTGTSFALCGSAATAATQTSTVLPAVYLTKVSSTSVKLAPRTFTTKVDIANGSTVIRNLLADTLSHTIRLNTTKYAAPYIKFSPDGVEQTYFKILLKKTAIASTASVNVNIVDANGDIQSVSLPAKSLTAGVMQTITGGDIVTAAKAAGHTVPVQASGVYQFAGSIEITSTQDNLNVYALNGSGSAFTRTPLRVNPDAINNVTFYVQ